MKLIYFCLISEILLLANISSSASILAADLTTTVTGVYYPLPGDDPAHSIAMAKLDGLTKGLEELVGIYLSSEMELSEKETITGEKSELTTSFQKQISSSLRANLRVIILNDPRTELNKRPEKAQVEILVMIPEEERQKFDAEVSELRELEQELRKEKLRREFYPQTIAILPLKTNEGENSEIDALFHDIFLEELLSDSKLRPVERKELDRLIQELQINQSDLFDQNAAVRMGRILGAGYLVLPSLTRIDKKVIVSARVIRTETSEIVAAWSKRGKWKQCHKLIEKNLSELVLQLNKNIH